MTRDYVLKIVPGLYLGTEWSALISPARAPHLRSFVSWTGAQRDAARFTAIQAGRALEILRGYEHGRHAFIVRLRRAAA